METHLWSLSLHDIYISQLKLYGTDGGDGDGSDGSDGSGGILLTIIKHW